MIKPPLTRSIASLLSFSMVAAQPFATVVATAGPSYGSGSSVGTAAERERLRRYEYLERGKAALAAGQKALRDKDYETAVSQYKLACDLIPNSPNTQAIYADALHGFCTASCRFAEQRIAEGRYLDAQVALKTVIDERYNPHCRDAVIILARLDTPGYYNQTIGPKFRATVEEVKQLLLDSQGFYDSGRYNLAAKRCEQVLNLDPYNMAARKMQEKINLARDDYSNVARRETRSRAMWLVDQAWALPVRKFGLEVGEAGSQGITTASTAKIQAKLQQIVIPKLEFRQATIREAVEYLKRRSVDLDPTTEVQSEKGVNIVLQLNEGGGGVPLPAPAPGPAVPAIPGLEPLPGAAPAPEVAAPAPSFGASGDQTITLSLSNVPLATALTYVTQLAGLKYKVEPFAVAIVPQSVDTTVLYLREWKVRPGFITRAATGAGGDAGAGLAPAAASGDATTGGSGLTGRLDAKDYLTSIGISFPGEASATYLAAGSRLIVRNTPENLDFIDQLVQADNQGNDFAQVEIEAKFVEITQNNLKELSFDWLLGAANVPGSPSSVFVAGGTDGFSLPTNPADFPFTYPGGTPVGRNPVTAGTRSGVGAISQNAIDALLFGAAGNSAAAPGILSVAGVFTDPTFQVVIRALNQKKGVDLLSAPKVTTKSGQRAVIEVIREFRYPTEFDPPQIPQNFGSTGGFSVVGTTPAGFGSSNTGSFPVTPTTPTAFETRNTGVTLEVEPVVGPDGYTIDLNLVPQVVEFEGFINYGSPIQSTSTNALGQSITSVITPNIINQPIFSTRKVTTTVSVFDGSTVVLGGLMREDVQTVEDKVPFFGDIPLVGRLFRSNVDQHLKRNLVIFVSARLINPAGEAVRNEDDLEEEIVATPPPELPMPEFMPK